MNEQIQAGAEIHSDKGYEIGTQEKYEAFVKERNKSLAQARIKELWENSDEIYTRYPEQGSPIYAGPELLEKFAELIVRECIKESMEEIVADEEIAREKDPLSREYLNGNNQGVVDAVVRFRNHFGVEE